MKRVLCLSAGSIALMLAAGGTVTVLNEPVLAQAPAYRAVPLWPQPFPDQSWVLGSITGVAVDAQNNVWAIHRGFDSLEGNEKGMMLKPPTSSVCCQAAPFVVQWDANGKFLQAWGGPGTGYAWPSSPGSLTVDGQGNVWIAASGLEPAPPGAARGRGGAPPPAPPPVDAHVLKFSRDGKFLLQIGAPGKTEGPSSQTSLNRPAAVAVDTAANEVYVADSGNHRVVVFDASKGTYKRHWFAYGETTAGADAGAYDAAAPPSKSFRDVTCIDISRDGIVYVCDRTSNRIQAFTKDGKFVKEGIVSRATGGAVVTGQFGVVSSFGSAWDLALSSDKQQQYLFVANGHDKKVHIVRRDSLTPIASFGSGGRYPGQFLAVGSIATDATGNIYTGEQHHGKRVQKFVTGR